jgi:hypothetical protein
LSEKSDVKENTAVLFRTYKQLKHRRAGRMLTKENLTRKFILSTTGFVVVMLKTRCSAFHVCFSVVMQLGPKLV